MAGDTVGVDTGNLEQLSNELESSGNIVKGQASKVTRSPVGVGDVGQNYAAEGKDIQTRLEGLGKRVDSWSTATVATAGVIRAAAKKYSAVDTERSTQMAAK